MRLLEASVANLYDQDLYAESEFDFGLWYVPDVRVVGSSVVEVDSCEVWSLSYYTASTGAFWSSEAPELVPQTITIELLDIGWRITGIVFYDPPHFC